MRRIWPIGKHQRMISSLQQLLVSRYPTSSIPCVSFSCCVAFFWSDFWSTIWGACSNVWKWFRVYGFPLHSWLYFPIMGFCNCRILADLVSVKQLKNVNERVWRFWASLSLCCLLVIKRHAYMSFLYPNISNNCATKNSNPSLWILLLAGKITNPILSGANADRWQHLHSPSYCWGMWYSGGEGNGSWGEGLPNMGWGTSTQRLGKPFCK